MVRTCARCIYPLCDEARYCLQCGLQVSSGELAAGERKAANGKSERRPELILTISREESTVEKPAPARKPTQRSEPPLGRRVLGATFAPSFLKELRAWSSSPRYLEGQLKLIVGEETASGWIARGLMDDFSDSDRPVPSIGWVACNQNRIFSPGWSRRGEPYLLINVERERTGELCVSWGSYAAGYNVDEADRAAMHLLFEDTLFDRMRYGDVDVKIWRTAWIPMWKQVVRDRNREFAGFLLGTVQRGSVSISVEIYESVVISSGDDISVSLTSEDHASCKQQAGGSGLSIVGWWHSHPAQGITMSRLDSKKHFEFFPAEYGAHSVAIVVMPHARRPSMRAGIFLPIRRTITPAIGTELAYRVPDGAKKLLDDPSDLEDDWGLNVLPSGARPAGRTLLVDELISSLIEAAPVLALAAPPAVLPPKASRLRLPLACCFTVLIAFFLMRSDFTKNTLSAMRERIQRNLTFGSARSKGTPAADLKSFQSSAAIVTTKPEPTITNGGHHNGHSGSSHKTSKAESHAGCCSTPHETNHHDSSSRPAGRRQFVTCHLTDGQGNVPLDSELKTVKIADYSLTCSSANGVGLKNCCQGSFVSATEYVGYGLLELEANDKEWNALLGKWRLGRDCRAEPAPAKNSSLSLVEANEAVLMLQCVASETKNSGG